MIDSEKITNEISKVSFEGDENGLIPAFGVYLTNIFADYYNRISYEFETEFNKLTDDPEIRNASKTLLIEAGHVCAFNTFGGIMTSPEWEALVLPMITSIEDWVYGIVAIINSLGWGKWKVNEIIPGEKLKLTIENGFESNYYINNYTNKSSEPKCYLAAGASAGLMNLIYYGKINTNPTLDEEFYDKLFHHNNGYKAIETKCRSMGHDICEFEVVKI